MRRLFAAKLALAVGGVLLLVTTACQENVTSAKDREAAAAAGTRAHAAEVQAAEDARKAMNLRLDQLQHRLDAIKTDAKPATAKAKHELDEQTKVLQDQVAELRTKLANDQWRSDEWNKVKANVEEGAKRIDDKINDLTHSHK